MFFVCLLGFGFCWALLVLFLLCFLFGLDFLVWVGFFSFFFFCKSAVLNCSVTNLPMGDHWKQGMGKGETVEMNNHLVF